MGKKLSIKEVVEKCRKIHGDRYEYPSDMLERKDEKKRLPIICSEHGVFWQVLHNHLKGCGCPKCGRNYRMTTDEFVKFLKDKYGHLNFSFENVKYVNNVTPVEIICSEHGSFVCLPSSIKNNLECPECQKKRLSLKNTKSQEQFIKECKEKHGDKYDYSKVEYVNAKTKVCIICPEHGEFWQLPNSHLKGSDCPRCSYVKMWDNRGRKGLEELIEQGKFVHDGYYDYSKVVYKGIDDKVEIICPKHGSFFQTMYCHIKMKQGCPECAKEKLREKFNLGTEEFIKRSMEIHHGKYDYSKVKYINNNTKVEIICKKHGSYFQAPVCHLKGFGCPICSDKKPISNAEKELRDFIKNECEQKIIPNDRSIINPLEVDMYLPQKSVAIEFDGLYWHSNEKIGKNYHLNKTNKCNERGVRLIHIFEDEWNFKKNIVKSRLKAIFGIIGNKIPARKCVIKEVAHDECKKFLEQNHIQGSVNSKYRYGLYYNDDLVSIMTFGNKRKSLGSKAKEGEYEMFRFCNKTDTIVIGGASKLLKHFIKQIEPKVIISYADKRWSDGNLYKTLGFEIIKHTDPNYFYIVNNHRENRFKYRKSELIKEGFDPNLTEEQIMKQREIKRIYDCGTMVFRMEIEKED